MLLHEIFGIDVYVRDSAGRLAGLGYVVLAPDLYWRTQPGLELNHEPAGVEAGMAAVRKLDVPARASGARRLSQGAVRRGCNSAAQWHR